MELCWISIKFISPKLFVYIKKPVNTCEPSTLQYMYIWSRVWMMTEGVRDRYDTPHLWLDIKLSFNDNDVHTFG